jgi:predicted nucleic acid-binding protein
MFVVDASITLTWCFEDESTEATDAVLHRLLLEGGIAPAHWPLEVANSLRSADRRGRLSEAAMSRARSTLADLPIDVVPIELSTALGLVDIAKEHDLSIYDATYLDLADIRGIGLATVDGRLADACRSAGVPLIAA